MTAQSLNYREQQKIAARALKKAGEICPFLEFHLRDVYPGFGSLNPGGAVASFGSSGGSGAASSSGTAEGAHASTPADERAFQGFYDFSSVEEIPSKLLCFSGPGLGAQSKLDGLFLASKESFPELGSLGSAVAALEGVAWIAHRSGLPGPINKKNLS